MSGVIGLRYEAIPPTLALLGIKKKHRAELFAALRIMETEALTVLKNG